MYLNDHTKLSTPCYSENTDPNVQDCCGHLNNVGAANVRPNHPDVSGECCTHSIPMDCCHHPLRLWLIKYSIRGTAKFIGLAWIVAPDLKTAQCVFGKNSQFNGFVERIKINEITEVFPSPEPVLIMEDSAAVIDKRNLHTYPFLLKSDFLIYQTELNANIAKAIQESWEQFRKQFKSEVYNSMYGDNYITITPQEDSVTIVHAESGVTSGDYGQAENAQLDFNTNTQFNVTYATVDSQGHITSIADKTITIPTTEATQLLHGLMSALDKKKLDEIGINTTNTTALTPANELFDSVTNNNVIQLHKIAKTGTFSDLLNIPDGVLTINYPKGDGTTETKTFTDNADTNETVTIPSEIDDTLAQDYKTYSSNKIEDFVDESIGKGNLIIQKNGTNLPVSYGNNQSKQSFGANDYDACIVNIPVPTKTSDLTNDGEGVAGYPFITKAVNNLENYYTEAEVDNLISQLETNIDWKEAVNTYADIATTYPNPQDGWTVNVKDTDYTYRYNGTEWVAISANAIPLATQSVNGLMSAADKTKLDGIEAGAEVNVQSDWNQTTTTADDYIKNKPTIGNGKLTITVNNNNNNKLEFNANQTNDTTFNINTETNVFRTAITKNGSNVDVLYDNKDWGIGVNSNNQLQINGKFVKQVEDFFDYANPTIGDVVQYIGNTDSDYTHNYFYEYQEVTPAEYEYEITVGPNDYGVPEGVYESQDPVDIFGYRPEFSISFYRGVDDGYWGPPSILISVGSKIWSYSGANSGIYTVVSISGNQYTLDNGDVISYSIDQMGQEYIFAADNGNYIALNNKASIVAKCVGNGFVTHDNRLYADIQPFFNSTNEGLEEYITIEETIITPATYGWVQTDVQPAPILGDLASINTNGDTTQYLRGDGNWSTIPSSVTIWEGTLAQYNQISPKDPNTIYLISD